MFFINFSPDWTKIDKVVPEALFKDLAKLDTVFDPHPWKLDHWLALADSQDEALFTLGVEKIIGWAVFKLVPADNLAHLLKILILPEYRKNGLGETLLKKSISQLKENKYLKFYLEVEKGNPAISIYKKNGFLIIHEIPNFYGQGRNAIVMMRQD
jgi:ribosomal protein S18 acetylase RimI-like enzyme